MDSDLRCRTPASVKGTEQMLQRVKLRSEMNHLIAEVSESHREISF